MTVWHVILLATAATLALKLAGHLVPPSFLERDREQVGQTLVVDARIPALVVAAALYAVRTPFIVVVAVAALVAAGIRLFV